MAENAVVRFYGIPILAAPVLTFPITGARKSGWLPPNFDLSNTHGLEVSAPYYWNIAPNLDATITPGVSTRRGGELTTELRYLEPRWRGEAEVFSMPDDRVAERSRWAGRNDRAHGIGHQLGCHCRQSVEPTIGRAVFDCEIAAFDIAPVLEALPDSPDLSIIELSAQ